MAELLVRTASDLLVRADTAGRTVFGYAVPFGQVATVNDGRAPYKESFQRGAFARTIEQRGGRIRLHRQHDSGRNLPVGRAVELEERDAGLWAAFAVSRTSEGDDVLALVEDGVVDSFSIGFRSIRHRPEGDVTVRTEVALHEVSIVSEPAYAGAAIVGVRAHGGPQISVAAAYERLALIRRR